MADGKQYDSKPIAMDSRKVSVHISVPDIRTAGKPRPNILSKWVMKKWNGLKDPEMPVRYTQIVYMIQNLNV